MGINATKKKKVRIIEKKRKKRKKRKNHNIAHKQLVKNKKSPNRSYSKMKRPQSTKHGKPKRSKSVKYSKPRPKSTKYAVTSKQTENGYYYGAKPYLMARNTPKEPLPFFVKRGPSSNNNPFKT